MAHKVQAWILALTAAVIGAILIGTVVHDLIGLSRWRIREEALAGAALIGIACAAQSLFRRIK
jgi:hypothetical protein